MILVECTKVKVNGEKIILGQLEGTFAFQDNKKTVFIFRILPSKDYSSQP